MKIGIMQGRLVPPEGNRFQSFPRDSWRLEFSNAKKAGLECIEWIYDCYGEDVNPISTTLGIEEMKLLSDKYSVKVLSVCADYFMDKPFLRVNAKECNDRINKLIWLINQCSNLSINRIVLPFVDNSQIQTDSELDDVIRILNYVLPFAEENRIEIHLETSLAPEMFKDLLSRIPHSLLKANYDSGNSSSLGYNPSEEFAAYGERIGSIHIKDRIKGGGTVPLGNGDADFKILFENIKRVNYSGDFILQAARNKPGDEVQLAIKNKIFVIEALKNVGL